MPSVLVTGANGFLAFHLVRTLLDRGYDVVGTVRSEAKSNVLRRKLNNANLEFAVVEDIVAPGAFDEVLKTHQFDAVFHTSSPATLSVQDVETELYQPAVQGTTAILKSIHEWAPSVKQVVVTSSFVAMFDATKGDWPEKVYDESDWNPITYEEGLTSGFAGHFSSKKLAEQTAWDFMAKEQPTFSLTTILPPWVWGPSEETDDISRLGVSANVLYGIFNGTVFSESPVWAWVATKDVALAHVLAIESPSAANQRYFITGGNFSAQAITNFIWDHYPERAAAKGLPKGTPNKLYPEAGVYGVDNTKSIRDLGMTYSTLESMLEETFKRFEEMESLKL